MKQKKIKYKSYIPKVKTKRGWIYDYDKRFKTRKEASEYAYEDWYMDDPDWFITSGAAEFILEPNVKLIKLDKYTFETKNGRFVIKKYR